jgi:hypothetical protein
LLRGQPTSFNQAVESVKEVDYALNFETKSAESAPKEINAIGKPHPMEDPKLAFQLQQVLDQLIMRLKALEARLQSNSTDQAARNRNPTQNYHSNNVESMPLFKLRRASAIGGRLAMETTYVHQTTLSIAHIQFRIT